MKSLVKLLNSRFATCFLSILILPQVLVSCYSYPGSNVPASGYRANPERKAEWNAYRATSPFCSLKMWAVSLPSDDKVGLGCVSDKNFAELTRRIQLSEAVSERTQDKLIRDHILETTSLWREIASAQPSLRNKAIPINQQIEDAGNRGARAVSESEQDMSFTDRGHLSGIAGLGSMLKSFGPMMELFRPHTAKYAPRALELAKREQELDRLFQQRGDCVEFIRGNIEELEVTVSKIR